MEQTGTKKFKRIARLLAVLTRYGFGDLIVRGGFSKLIPENVKEKSREKEGLFSLSVYERIRMALEELGPAYVKFGQMFSNREDLLPKELIAELLKLQDNVSEEDINIRPMLEEELSTNSLTYFKHLDEKPFASASMAQVFRATLSNGDEVVLKVKRKNIQEMIEADLLIMRDLIHVLEDFQEDIKKMDLIKVLDAFDRSIHDELSFVNELNNIKRFGKNFEGNQRIHVPAVYPGLSNNNIICMEYIRGIKVTDIESLQRGGFDPKQVAVAGFDLYMLQVLEYGFFHADPHPGNILVTYEGRIAFIDFGAMGMLTPQDKVYLEDFIQYLLQKDIRKVILTIKKIAVTYEVTDERELEREMYIFIDTISSSALKDIDIKSMGEQLKRILSKNQITLPAHIYYLLKGITLLEGIGTHLDPDIDIFGIIKPYGQDILRRRYSPRVLLQKGITRLNNLSDTLSDIPDEISEVLKKINNNNLQVNHRIEGLPTIKKTMDKLVLALIISALSIGSAILVLADMPPRVYGVPVLGFIGFIISGVLGAYVVVSIMRSK